MYSSIFAFNVLMESDLERSSTTKSGQIGANLFRSCSVSAFHLSLRIHERSGERFAPFGKVNSVEESNPLPVPSCLTQTPKLAVNSKFLAPVIVVAGGITMRS